MNQTKPIRILLWVPLLLAVGGGAVYFFWLTSRDVLANPLYSPTETEWLTYLMLGLGCVLFYWMVQNHVSGAAKTIAPLILALATTVLVMLLNNFWRYLAIGTFLRWENYPAYSILLRQDLLYVEGGGWSRYPFCFFGLYLLCGARDYLAPLQSLFDKLWVCEEKDGTECCDQCPHYGTCSDVE